jgi:RND family efflux transporter MFP subunit
MRATVANPRQELLPGMFVRARLTKKQEQQAILVPQASIVRNNRGEAMVMLVNDKSEVEARPVQTGQNLGDKIVITEGLHDGDRLIVEGLQKIKPGVPVSVAAQQPGVQAQAAPIAQTPAKKAE